MRGWRWLLSVAVVCMLTPAWSAQEGETAPDFSLPSVGGEAVSLADLDGKVVAIAFWASWGKHCSEQLKLLDELADKWTDKGLVVLGINQREDPSRVADFADRHRLSMKMLLDDGTTARAYGSNGVPDLWILDRRGLLRARFIGYGPTDHEGIQKAIEAALSEPVEAPPPTGPAPTSLPALLPARLRAYAHLQMGAAHINIGDAFVKGGYRDYGHFAQALREFRAGLLLDPENVDLHIWLGLALERKGDLPTAIQQYQAALKLEPSSEYAQDALQRLGVPWRPPRESNTTE